MRFSMGVAARIALAAGAFALCGTAAFAQQTLADADWFEREIGEGVVWRFYLFDNLFGSKQSLSYIEVDLTNPNVSIEFPYVETGRVLTSSMVPTQFPEAVGAVNGTYFNTGAGGGHKTYLRVNGVEIPPGGDLFSPWGYEGALALDASGNPSMEEIPGSGWNADTTHPDILACGPLLIVEGFIPTTELNAIGAHCTARHPRSAVGLTDDNRMILLTVDGRTEMSGGMTCEELALTMEQLGCTGALNLDGGGSTTLWGKGEPYNGVLNYPTDNGQYDHEGERACTNAIAVTSSEPTPGEWDARLVAKIFNPMMEPDAVQTVTLSYENLGTSAWTAEDTRLVLARPETRLSPFQAAAWPSTSQPAAMTPATVPPGGTGTFSFTLKAPADTVTAFYDEHFMLTQDGVGRIGPADSEAWMKIVVQPPVLPGDDFIVESRLGGQNFGWYSDSGMASAAVNCTAPGCTPGIGARYGSTYRSVAGAKNATVAPDFPGSGLYNVHVAWGAGSSRRTPITYHVNHLGGTNTFQIDQTVTANEWVQLGTGPYLFKKGLGGTVVMTNEDIDLSGSMFANAVKFELADQGLSDKSYEVRYQTSLNTKPAIDGTAAAGEWDGAAPAATDFVAHDNPSLPAQEDADWRMLYDEDHLYILVQMSNAHLPGYTAPTPPVAYTELAGDRINFFFTPFGISTDPFYRIILSPNPTTSQVHVWSQANLTRTTNATVGTDWVAGGDAAYSYAGGVLTIEYRVPWSAFNYGAMATASAPGNGAVWGVQPAISNQLTPSTSEAVNWEPDTTGGYVMGNPFGSLIFVQPTTGFSRWEVY